MAKNPYSGKKESFNEISVRELKLYEENDSNLYFKSKTPIYNNLDKKRTKGTYDPKKAEVAFKHHADKSAKAYEKEFGSGSSVIFSPADRRQVAKELRQEYENTVGER